MQVKVCGMRDPENLKALAQLPIDLIGFIFFEKSKRNINEPINAELLKTIHQKKVGVFVNEEIAIISSKIMDYQLDFLQLHGDESPEYCQKIKEKHPELKLIKVFSVGEIFDFKKTEKYSNTVHFFLFDTKGKERGGNGVQFNWDLLKKYKGETPFLLSGGIELKDAERINNFKHPLLWGIDVNSGFEIQPAVKDLKELSYFLERIEK